MGKFRVTGAVAVVRSENKSERYLYRDAVFEDDGLDPANLKHLQAVGLIEKLRGAAPKTSDESSSEDKYKGVSADDLKLDLEKRNEGRDDADKIVPAEPSNKPEVLAALIADDAKQANQQ